MGAQTVVCSLSEALCARHTPMGLTLEAHSTALLTIERAADRLATTGPTPCATRDEPGCHPIGRASERGVGVVAGSPAADGAARWVSEPCPAWPERVNRRRP